jgi:16S rRNA (cytosine1402-N4)-methyltransferase
MAKKKKPHSRKRIDKSQQIDYDYHLPVLKIEACDLLVQSSSGLYLDGTLGGGGHTAEILSRLDDQGSIYSFDQDLAAIEHCKNKFAAELEKAEQSRLVLLNKNFSEACSIKEIRGEAKGLLLDLGVSSRQLDDSRRGFTYRANTHLDMRFGSQGKTAKELLNQAQEEELEHILLDYGEEPFAKIIARRIGEKRRAFPLESTFDLRLIVEETVPKKNLYPTLSRVFQAIRIAVNDELGVLQYTLENIVPVLAVGGRIVVISYHSLEDRIVKTAFRKLCQSGATKNITPKPITAGKKELLDNPRARSAKLRVVERV